MKPVASLFRARRRAGFSLMELLAVMAIMAMLITLAVTSYFAAIRGMARRSAVKHFANTLILARQRACMENTRVSVVLFNEVTGQTDLDITPSYVVCKEIGRLSHVRGLELVDEFSEIEKIFGVQSLGMNYRGSIRLYNLTQGRWSHIFPWVAAYPWETGGGLPRESASAPGTHHNLNAFAFRINENVQTRMQSFRNWRIGDAYGVEAAPAGSLPRHFAFERPSRAEEAVTITFEPDGRAQRAETIFIRETQPPNRRSRISVTSEGAINYDEQWN